MQTSLYNIQQQQAILQPATKTRSCLEWPHEWMFFDQTLGLSICCGGLDFPMRPTAGRWKQPRSVGLD